MRFFPFAKKTRTEEPSETDSFLEAMSRGHAISWFDPTSKKVIEANAMFCEIMGYDAREIIGVSHDDFVDPSMCDNEADSGFFAALNGENRTAGIVPRRTKSGALRWLHTSYVPILSSDGKPSKIAKICLDVTAKHQEVRVTVEQLQAISNSQAKIVFDLEGTILETNANFQQTMGYTAEELVGKKHSMFVEPGYAQSPRYVDFWREIREGGLQTGLFRRFRKDGKPRWLQATYSPIVDRLGRIVKVVKVATDVTEREEAQDITKVMTEFQGVIEFDVDGTIRTANKHFQDAMGYTLDEIKGKHHRMFMQPGEADTEAYKEHWTLLAEGRFHMGEFKRRHKDGRDIWISATYHPIFGPKGGPVKVVKYATDITTRMTAVQELRNGLERLSRGDLKTSIDIDFSEDLEPLRRDFNSTLDRLRETIQTVVTAASEIHASTSEISGASNNLSQRTESQAAALEETAAAITEMAASVKSTAKIARNTQGLVEKTKVCAAAGTGVMTNARVAMDAISTSSCEISKITSMIEDIAFQTNLLALNAGVEAARAGEAGRGFAVVASEVRALAQRSSDAATQIAGLISTSAQQVDQGVDLVSRTSASLSEIETFVSEVAQMVGSIAAAASEQSGGLAEITSAISNLDEVTQQNAAMFEETNAATQTLSQEVETLGRISGSFKLDGEKPPAAQVRKADPDARRLAS